MAIRGPGLTPYETSGRPALFDHRVGISEERGGTVGPSVFARYFGTAPMGIALR
jgi:hypothetical protein